MKLTVAETKYVTLELSQQTVDVILDYALTNYSGLSSSISWLNKKGQIVLFPPKLDWDLSSFDLDTEQVRTYCTKRNISYEELKQKIKY